MRKSGGALPGKGIIGEVLPFPTLPLYFVSLYPRFSSAKIPPLSLLHYNHFLPKNSDTMPVLRPVLQTIANFSPFFM